MGYSKFMPHTPSPKQVEFPFATTTRDASCRGDIPGPTPARASAVALGSAQEIFTWARCTKSHPKELLQHRG